MNGDPVLNLTITRTRGVGGILGPVEASTSRVASALKNVGARGGGRLWDSQRESAIAIAR